MSLEALFCDVDDFCQAYLPHWQRQQLCCNERKRLRHGRMTMSEIMTLLIHFHQSHYRDLKAYYLLYVHRQLSEAFPNLLSSTRWVAGVSAAVRVSATAQGPGYGFGVH